jgi:hypothetical protein
MLVVKGIKNTHTSFEQNMHADSGNRFQAIMYVYMCACTSMRMYIQIDKVQFLGTKSLT